MISITKIFHFEMAHAIYGYPGACSNIHGHSYELHVSVTAATLTDEYIPSTGILFDFKELKKAVKESVINIFDHQLVLSEKYIHSKDVNPDTENLYVFDTEPSAENLLVFIRNKLEMVFPPEIRLVCLKLYETKESYATWTNYM